MGVRSGVVFTCTPFLKKDQGSAKRVWIELIVLVGFFRIVSVKEDVERLPFA